jgi:hypothetical protein
LVVDRAENEGGDGHIEAVVLERQILGWGSQEQRVWRMFLESPLQLSRAGFRGDLRLVVPSFH